MPPCIMWIKPEKLLCRKRCLARNMKGLLDLTRGVRGIMSEEDIKNATYATSATSRKLFCITPQVAYYKRHARTLRCILENSHIDAMPGGKKALAAKKKLDRRIHDLLNRLKGETDKHCKKMFKRLRREKDHLFTFLEVKGVEWHNNSAERGIRPCVILRNNSYGSRSEEDVAAIAVLMSVKQTCKAKKDNFLDVMHTYLIKTCQKTI